MEGFWDSHFVSEMAFHPRRVVIHSSILAKTCSVDGVIEINETISLGYRFYYTNKEAPVMIKFSGNAEVIGDMDSMYSEVFVQRKESEVSVLSIDYRGFGWSSGTPMLTKLCSDAEVIFTQLPNIFKMLDVPPFTPIILFGRSIGGCSALHLAKQYQNHSIPDLGSIIAIILESCFTNIKELPMVNELHKMMPQAAPMLAFLPDPFNNLEKMSTLKIPCLVLHGDMDEISPLKMGKDLYKKCSSQNKKMVIYNNCGHNDIAFLKGEEYYRDFFSFINIKATCRMSQVLCKQNRHDVSLESLDSMIKKYQGIIEESELTCLHIESAAVCERLGQFLKAEKLVHKALEKAVRDEVLECLLLKWRLKYPGGGNAHEDSEEKKIYINALKDEMIIDNEKELAIFAELSYQVTLRR